MTCPLWVRVILLVVHGIMLYALSAGPVVFFLEVFELQETIIWDICEQFYMPLQVLAGAFEPIYEFFSWYIDLWTPD
jgi:hypothetical protein